MRTTFRPSPPDGKAYAMIMVMLFLAATLLVLGSVMLWTDANTRQNARNNLYFASQAAAEAADEQIIANMNRDYLDQSLNLASAYSTNLPSQTNWPVKFQFSGTNSTSGSNTTYVYEGPLSTNLTPLTSQWAGLQGYAQTNYITSTARATNAPYTVPATVTESVQYADIPLFQFAIFYNMNLEIQPGQPMGIGGPVFCNDSIWAASTGLTFTNAVTAGGMVYTNNVSDPFMTSGSKTGSGNPAFDSTITTNHAELNLPIGTNNQPASVEAVLQLPGTNTSSTYLYNDAELIISNSSSFTNISVYYQNTNNAPAIAAVPMDKTNAGIPYYSFVTTTNFYDYREGKTVKAIYLNVTNLTVWINGPGSADNTLTKTDTGQNIDSVYIYNSMPLTSSNLPGVQIGNGAQLPSSSGLAVATPDPIYVWGNYNVQNGSGSDTNSNNTTYTEPAALYGDALTVLSASWNNTNYTSGTALGSRTPVATTINAATLEGIVPSSGTNYSGGVENFLRLLENWNSSTIPLYYNGSIVVMFPSQYATNRWQNTGVYYNAPARDWAFDTQFATTTGLPPMTPRVKSIIRNRWQP
jgi:hypothetical protein